MKKLRWTMDGGFWDVDMSTPITLDGFARPVPGETVPLGISRGLKLSRPKQLDFMHKFMEAHLVPSYTGNPREGGNGFSLQRVIPFSLGENWFATVLGQFHVQRFLNSVIQNASRNGESSLLKNIGSHIRDKSLYALGFCSEFLISSDTALLLSSDKYGDKNKSRNKAVFHHKFSHHNLVAEASSPGLFVDEYGNYWDVPITMAVDFASLSPDSGPSYHICMHHSSGHPSSFGKKCTSQIPSILLPGLCVKGAFSFTKNIDIWRGKGQKLRLVQPWDAFLSDPLLSTSAMIGVIANATCGDNFRSSSTRDDESQTYRTFNLSTQRFKSSLSADLISSISFKAQYGHFQRWFFDLTRIGARLDVRSGAKFLAAAANLAHDVYTSQKPNVNTLQAVCPDITLSLQQQIVGPFSFRVDSRISFDMKNTTYLAHIDDSVFAVEYAMKVLGSAKATAWYSPKHGEGMIELRFFET